MKNFTSTYTKAFKYEIFYTHLLIRAIFYNIFLLVFTELYGLNNHCIPIYLTNHLILSILYKKLNSTKNYINVIETLISNIFTF